MHRDPTQLLKAIEQGDPQAAEQLLPLIYDELRRLAAKNMRHEVSDHTLDATALVHEAYVRLVGSAVDRKWNGSRHFFAAAAAAMRRILIDDARRRQSEKAGGGLIHQQIDEALFAVEPRQRIELVALDEALNKLATVEPELARLVELRFFAGLSVDEAAELLGVSSRTAKRNWSYARAWLRREMDSQ